MNKRPITLRTSFRVLVILEAPAPLQITVRLAGKLVLTAPYDVSPSTYDWHKQRLRPCPLARLHAANAPDHPAAMHAYTHVRT